MAETMPQVSDRNREGTSGPKATILIVADSPALLESLMTPLTEQGYTVHAFLDGNPALKFVESTLPALVLLGVPTPGMDSYQVCRHLKTRERTRDIPIIFLTANTEALDLIVGFRLSAVDYIARPFEAEDVRARLATHLALRRQLLLVNVKQVSIRGATQLYTCWEISERKRAEAAHKESDARFSTLIDNLPVEFWAADRDLRVTI